MKHWRVGGNTREHWEVEHEGEVVREHNKWREHSGKLEVGRKNGGEHRSGMEHCREQEGAVGEGESKRVQGCEGTVLRAVVREHRVVGESIVGSRRWRGEGSTSEWRSTGEWEE